MSEPVQRVLDAAVEGQARSPRHIQYQLSKLHTTLVKDGSEIRNAIKSDGRHTSAEVEIQYALTLEAVAAAFADSDFDKALHAEFNLSRGENAPSKLSPYPTTYIVPSSYNFVYSCITAVATAIAAGSCVILELPKTLSRTTELVQKSLSSVLDRDTFVVVDKRIRLEDLPKRTIRVFGSADSGVQPGRNDLVPPSIRCVAIVDRTANMQEAASALLRARFSFGGKSPLAPDVVLVNEFRVKEFCSSIAELTSKYFAAQMEMNGTGVSGSAEKARAARASTQELDQAGADVLIAGSKGTVVRVDDRKSKLLRKRVQEPLLVIHPVRSIDDAIDFANGDGEETLSAIFAFGSPETAKYVSQFVNAHLCCANDIPVELLVGPPAPIGYAASLDGPYTKEMFCEPKPEFIQYGTRSSRIRDALDTNDVKQADQFRKEAESLNAKVKQPVGKAIGFFEQGILLGFSLVLTIAVVSNVAFWRYGFPTVLKRWRH